MKAYTHVIYHKGCPDGFGAAFSAWMALGEKAHYLKLAYGEPMPVLPHSAEVLFVDFCPKPEELWELAKTVKGITILDHHQTAFEAMKDFKNPRVEVKFDMGHSGAYLAWEHFHGADVPLFIRYIEDRDLWAFKLPGSREVAASLSSYPLDFLGWNLLYKFPVSRLIEEGLAILRFQNQKVEEMCSKVRWKELAGHRIPYTNATVFFSEVGNRLCEIYPEVPFAAYYFDRADGKRQWGLRSPGRFDVSQVAKKMGGGGHPGAAGFVEDPAKV